MKCILCVKRKGKRFCPAKNTQICAQCCGEKRVIEIDCPADCTYLTSGQSYRSIKKYVAMMQQEQDPVRQRKFYETYQKLGGLLGQVEARIVGYAADLRTLTDDHVMEAVVLLRKTYRTEQKGVIYEHSSSNPLVQSLLRDLHSFLEDSRNQSQEAMSALKTDDLIDCLEAIEIEIGFHLEGDVDSENYLTFIKRNHPGAVSESSSDGGLIQV